MNLIKSYYKVKSIKQCKWKCIKIIMMNVQLLRVFLGVYQINMHQNFLEHKKAKTICNSLNKSTKKPCVQDISRKGFVINKRFWNTVKLFLKNKGFLTNETLQKNAKQKLSLILQDLKIFLILIYKYCRKIIWYSFQQKRKSRKSFRRFNCFKFISEI